MRRPSTPLVAALCAVTAVFALAAPVAAEPFPRPLPTPSAGEQVVRPGWTNEGTTWFYIDPGGTKHTGWLRWSGAWYYFYPRSGALAAGPVEIGGTTVLLDATGKLAPDATGAAGAWAQLKHDPAWSVGMLVNKKNPLEPLDYEPPLELVASTGWLFMQPEAAFAVDEMLAAAARDGVAATVMSAYRSFGRQVASFSEEVSEFGATTAEQSSARPGYSEHQAGLAADIASPTEGCWLQACFGDTSAGRWLKANAWQYGFIIRYPEGATDITGYGYEPWHVRYVGVAIATEMHANGIATLEEFYGAPAAPHYD